MVTRHNSKDKTVKLSRALEFSFSVLIKVVVVFAHTACCRLMVEHKHSVKDLADNKTDWNDYLETDNSTADLGDTEDLERQLISSHNTEVLGSLILGSLSHHQTNNKRTLKIITVFSSMAPTFVSVFLHRERYIHVTN